MQELVARPPREDEVIGSRNLPLVGVESAKCVVAAGGRRFVVHLGQRQLVTEPLAADGVPGRGFVPALSVASEGSVCADAAYGPIVVALQAILGLGEVPLFPLDPFV